MAILEMFSEARLELQRELMRDEHSELWSLVAKHPPQEFELRLAEIASYCSILLDGCYSQGELDNLCRILTTKLAEKRTGFILSAKH